MGRSTPSALRAFPGFRRDDLAGVCAWQSILFRRSRLPLNLTGDSRGKKLTLES
jgi:hypothetical protein